VQKETGMKKNNSGDKQQKAGKAVKEFGEQQLFALAAVGNGGHTGLTIWLDLGDRSC